MDLRTSLREHHAGTFFLAGGVVLSGIYFLVPDGTPQSVLYDGVGIGSALAIGLGVYLNRPETRSAVAPLRARQPLLRRRGHHLRRPRRPAGAVGRGLVLPRRLSAARRRASRYLVFHAGGHHRFAALVEAAIVTVAFALFQWVFVVDRIVDGAGSVRRARRRRPRIRRWTCSCSRGLRASSSPPPGGLRPSSCSSRRS